MLMTWDGIFPIMDIKFNPNDPNHFLAGIANGCISVHYTLTLIVLSYIYTKIY